MCYVFDLELRDSISRIKSEEHFENKVENIKMTIRDCRYESQCDSLKPDRKTSTLLVLKRRFFGEWFYFFLSFSIAVADSIEHCTDIPFTFSSV